MEKEMSSSHKYNRYDEDPCEKCSKNAGSVVVNNQWICAKCAKKLKKQSKGESDDSVSAYLISNQ